MNLIQVADAECRVRSTRESIMAKRKALSEQQMHLIAKALADPRRHEIPQQIGACKDTASCTDIRECQPVTAAMLDRIQ